VTDRLTVGLFMCVFTYGVDWIIAWCVVPKIVIATALRDRTTATVRVCPENSNLRAQINYLCYNRQHNNMATSSIKDNKC
jgi:hypothetical protein